MGGKAKVLVSQKRATTKKCFYGLLLASFFGFVVLLFYVDIHSNNRHSHNHPGHRDRNGTALVSKNSSLGEKSTSPATSLRGLDIYSTPTQASGTSSKKQPPNSPDNVHVRQSDQRLSKSDRSGSAEAAATKEVICPDVLAHALDGSWVERGDIDDKERREIMRYYRQFKRILPPSNRKCGNVTNNFRWRRALCDDDSDLPCCMDNICVNRTAAECKCENCIDHRNTIVAELASWKPKRKECSFGQLPETEICRLLNHSQVLLIGDSLMRELHSAFLMYARNDFRAGGLKAGAAAAVVANCSGIWSFDRRCLSELDFSGPVCNNKQHISLLTNYKVVHNVSIINTIANYGRKANKRTIVVFNMGIWEAYHADRVLQYVLQPLLRRLREEKFPPYRLLWLSNKAPGIMKPIHEHQSRQDALNYNTRVNAFMWDGGIPVLDTFGMTDGIRSYDGTHHALGVNRLIAQTFFQYLIQLERRGLW